eukprot:scaffold28564_cov22-Prasinocladus_malaysianus.AAC.2
MQMKHEAKARAKPSSDSLVSKWPTQGFDVGGDRRVLQSCAPSRLAHAKAVVPHLVAKSTNNGLTPKPSVAGPVFLKCSTEEAQSRVGPVSRSAKRVSTFDCQRLQSLPYTYSLHDGRQLPACGETRTTHFNGTIILMMHEWQQQHSYAYIPGHIYKTITFYWRTTMSLITS